MKRLDVRPALSAKLQAPADSTVGNVANAVFSVLLVVALATVPWRLALLAWRPVWKVSLAAPDAGSPQPAMSQLLPAGQSTDLGLLALAPLLAILIWVCGRIFNRRNRPWSWGSAAITLPLLLLTLLSLSYVASSSLWQTLQIGVWGLTWLIYLFIVNERPNLTLPLAVVVVIQGLTGAAQFFAQSDLGLRFLGELPLDRTLLGVSVVEARGHPWLRAYGLTMHPNVLGALLAIALLLLLPAFVRARGRRQVALAFVFACGILGLLATFSRAGWLAFGCGYAAWLLLRGRYDLQEAGAAWRARLLLVLAPLVLAPAFFLLYGDVAMSRVLDVEATPTEAQSINERMRDADTALALIATHPWRGVGAGGYLAAAQGVDAEARMVHNVPLLVTAELGLPGGLLWLALMLGGLWAAGRDAGPWLAMLIIGMLDTNLWPTVSWQGAIVFGLMAAMTAWPIAGRLRQAPTDLHLLPAPYIEGERATAGTALVGEPARAVEEGHAHRV